MRQGEQVDEQREDPAPSKRRPFGPPDSFLHKGWTYAGIDARSPAKGRLTPESLYSLRLDSAYAIPPCPPQGRRFLAVETCL